MSSHYPDGTTQHHLDQTWHDDGQQVEDDTPRPNEPERPPAYLERESDGRIVLRVIGVDAAELDAVYIHGVEYRPVKP